MTNPRAAFISTARVLEAIQKSLHYLQALNLTLQTNAIIVYANLIAIVLSHAIDTNPAAFEDFNFTNEMFNFTLNKVFKEEEAAL